MKQLGYYLDAFFKAETQGQQELAWSIIVDIVNPVNIGIQH